jgi:hypothetical protein
MQTGNISYANQACCANFANSHRSHSIHIRGRTTDLGTFYILTPASFLGPPRIFAENPLRQAPFDSLSPCSSGLRPERQDRRCYELTIPTPPPTLRSSWTKNGGRRRQLKSSRPHVLEVRLPCGQFRPLDAAETLHSA